MEQWKLNLLMRQWKEGVAMYRAGTHPRQKEITRALVEYLSKYPTKKEAEG
jgi:predicted metal-dependent hydrolase